MERGDIELKRLICTGAPLRKRESITCHVLTLTLRGVPLQTIGEFSDFEKKSVCR